MKEVTNSKSRSGNINVELLPLTDGQKQLWIGQMLNPESPLYNMAICCSIHGELDQLRFEHAWSTVVLGIDILHTRFVYDNGEPHQTICKTPLPLTFLDLCTKKNASAAAQAWMQQQVDTVIPLDGVLVQAALIKLASDKWIWFCNQHHLITDATSFTALWSLLCEIYTGSQSIGKDASTYQDYIHSLIDLSADGNPGVKNQRKVSREYWQNLELPPSLSLYGRHPGPHDTGSSRESESLGLERATKFNALANTSEVRSFNINLTRFQLVLTAYITYLHRVSGQQSVAVSVPAPNRSNAQFRTTPGLFVELLPLVVEIEPEETFTSLFAKVRTETMNFLKHSFPGACAAVPSRKVSAVLNYVPLTMNAIGDFQVSTEWIHSGHADSHHLIRMHITDWNDSGELSISLDCNTACFNTAHRAAIRRQFYAVLDALIDGMDQRIDDVNITRYDGKLEDQQPVSSAPSTAAVNNGDDKLIIERIDRVAKEFATQPAVSDLTNTWTYAEFYLRVNKLCESLQQQGAGAGKQVAVLLSRSMSLPVAVLGIMKSGAAYLPIESNNPAERIKFQLVDSRSELVVTDAANVDQLPPSVRYLLLDGDGFVLAANNATGIEQSLDTSNQPDGQSAAYILYTSGSTGAPKGVIVSNAALTNYCTWAVNHYTQGRRLTFPLFTPLGFDLTVTSLFVPLLSGGQIRVYAPTNPAVDDTLHQLIDDNAVDIVKLTPAHLAMIQDRDLTRSRITQLIVGGEDFKCALARKIYKAFAGKVEIYNEYGPTEATVGCVVHRFDPAQDTKGSVPIGRPVAGMTVAVLNRALQQQPAGVSGELFLSGPSLADGYWQQPELTNNRFISAPNQHLDHAPSVTYRTGDQVRFNDSGNLVYLGRNDDQLKIRGARVELAEIESAALKLPAITRCVATAVSSESTLNTGEEKFCMRCGISSIYPDLSFDTNDVCSLCNSFEQYRDRAKGYFKPMAELEALSNQVVSARSGKYDCMMLLSGGKDSTYALARLVDLNLSVLAYTLDNGYISEEAKINIERVCNAIGVDHEFGQTPAMAEIFVDSLRRFSNVCNGCFKTIYTLSMQRASELDIGYIFTGLSRGQFFETRLTEELLTDPAVAITDIDDIVLSARKAYHRTDDAVAQLLNTDHLQDDEIFEQIKFVDFYRYCDVDLDDMLSYLQTRLPWVRPKDTGRSTNCLINDVGIYVHKLERGYHNYALPYSWDVRLGHKQREAALDELNDQLDAANVTQILDELGYECDEPPPTSDTSIALYYETNAVLDPAEVQRNLAQSLPDWMMPRWTIPLASMPLSENGKIDKNALPKPFGSRVASDVEYAAPGTVAEQLLAQLWREQLKLDQVGVHDNFFSIGGDSLSAIRIASILNQRGFLFKTADIFKYQTIAELAQLTESKERSNHSPSTEAPPEHKAFGSLKPGQLDKLSQLIGRNE